MSFRLYLSLLAVFLICFAACARKEKAVLDLRVEEKVIEVKQDEVVIADPNSENISATGQSSQTAPQKMSDFSEITVMYDGFGNKLERRNFKGHPRLNSVIVKTAADGRREIIIYGQNGERKTIDGELGNRLLTASADEIANAAKIYETRPAGNRAVTVAGAQTRPQTPVQMPILQPQPQTELLQQPQPEQPQPSMVQQKETKVEEHIQETWEDKDAKENPRTNSKKEAAAEKKKAE